MSYSRPLYLTSPQMYGDDIKEVQTKLSQLNFFNGEIDGYFGNITKQAVLAFQKDAGLTADGSCGPATWSRLFRALFYTTPTITGTDVKIAQERLRSLNYYTDSIDGSFGPNCDLAVRAYQSSVGLSCDGSIGPNTWNSLFNSNTVNGATSEYTRPLFYTTPVITGNDVAQVQKKLKDLGYYNDSVDGSFGPNTELAVKSYQSVMNLEVDGSVGPATWNSLFNSNTVNGATSEYTRPLFYTTPIITGNDVAKVQQRLKQLGYYNDSVDGSFGPNTELAVTLFQSANNLTPDGSCGPATWNKLFSSSNVIGIGNTLLNGKKIFIDAGHGGSDSGAAGRNTAGTLFLEKDFALTISLEQKRLFESLGYQVMLSRSSDVYVSLETRVNLANSWGADLFISNHINAGGGTGIEVWASVGNSVGQSYASSIVNNISSKTQLHSRGVKTKTLSDGRDYFYVIRETTMTAILIEYGFIDNIQDLSFLQSIENQETLANLTVNALASNVSGTTSTQNDSLLSLLDELYSTAVSYVIKNGFERTNELYNHYCMDFLRHIVYNDAQWSLIIGSANEYFIKYVKNEYPNTYNRLLKYIQFNPSNIAKIYNYEIDLPHLAATTLGYISSPLVPDFWTGWGGDLATLMSDITRRIMDKNDTRTEQVISDELMGSSKYSFSKIDLEADIDAIYFAKNISTYSLPKLFQNYYLTLSSSTRRELFCNDVYGIPKASTTNEKISILSNDIYTKMVKSDEGFGYVGNVGGYALRTKAEYKGVLASNITQLAACKSLAKYIFTSL